MKEKVRMNATTSIVLGVIAAGITAVIEMTTGVTTWLNDTYRISNPDIQPLATQVALGIIVYGWLIHVRRSFLRQASAKQDAAARNGPVRNKLHSRGSVANEFAPRRKTIQVKQPPMRGASNRTNR